MTDTATAQALKPCPFCGSENVKAFAYGQNIGGEPDAFCQCQDCTTTGPSGNNEAEAIAAWTKRALSPAADAVRDEAKCQVCRGNDANLPCAYPSEGKLGCLRDARLKEAGALSDKEIRQDYNSTGDILAEMTGCYDRGVMLWELADRVRGQNAKLQKSLAYAEGQAAEYRAIADAYKNGFRRIMAKLAEAQKESGK